MSEAQLSRDQVKDYLKNLSLIDAAALVKELEAELGVSRRLRSRRRQRRRQVRRQQRRPRRKSSTSC